MFQVGGMNRTHCDAVLAWARGESQWQNDSDATPEAESATPKASAIVRRERQDVRGLGDLPNAEGVVRTGAAGEVAISGTGCQFEPKRAVGPLSRRCANCGRHELEHEH